MDSSLFITSRLLPIPHGFSTRQGGVSPAPWDSLNTGFSVGDLPERVQMNLDRLAEALGVPSPAIHTVSQIHGDRVVEVSGEISAATEADALWTAQAGHAVGTRTADCLPLLLVDPECERVAAVHAGWRGTALEIAGRMVEAWRSSGSRPERLLAAIGPHIRRCCYAVSSDLAAQFVAQFGPEVAESRGGDVYLDLSLAVQRTLARAGLRTTQIDALPACTACDATRYFSHRRDRGRTGRHLSVAICRF
ncbi:MAG TPA: peptidoglycan editing factor PgeF [Myxococcaceae bacterium]|nr:peptidoglycan editing factor PgeF [Myxococcaceae bacterium]